MYKLTTQRSTIVMYFPSWYSAKGKIKKVESTIPPTIETQNKIFVKAIGISPTANLRGSINLAYEFIVYISINSCSHQKMLSELLPEEKRRLHEIEQQLIELERGNSTIHSSDVFLGLQEMSLRLNDLEKLLLRESKAKKDDYRRRLQHLRASHSHVRDSLENYIKRTGSNDYSLQKAKLLASAAAYSQQDLELEMAESGSLSRSSQMIGEYLSIGQETLSELVNQRERLKSIQRKAFDMLNYLGVSNSLLKHIERRDGMDKWIVYGGMIMIVLLLFFVIWFLKK